MLAHPESDLRVSASADRMAMELRSFSRLFHGETRLNSGGIRRTGANGRVPQLEQPLLPVEKVGKNAGWAMRNECGAHFSAFLTRFQGLPGALSMTLVP